MRLSARQRQVVALRLLLDLDTNRTAEVLGITPNTVMAHMAQALAALRTDLMPERRQELIMNDDELITAVKESVTGVHMDIPAGQIVSRSRAIPARRRIPALAGALAVAAGTAVAVPMLLPSGHRPSHPARAQLAAWTVVKQADGGFRVTIHQLRDPAKLQRKLRADGIPVSVTFIGQSNPACQPYSFSGSSSQHRHLLDSMGTTLPGHGNPRVLVIHSSAFPAGAGLAIAAGHPGQSPRGQGVDLTIDPPVKASPQCTGS